MSRYVIFFQVGRRKKLRFSGKCFYSETNGTYCYIQQATVYSSPEAIKEKVACLKKEMPYFNFHQIRIRSKKNAKK